LKSRCKYIKKTGVFVVLFLDLDRVHLILQDEGRGI
jgi:hypothetical protein